MQPEAGKICPSCKKFNGPDALFCTHCGTPFEVGNNKVSSTTSHMSQGTTTELLEHPRPPETAPESGIAFYFVDEKLPFELRSDDEFVLGRKTDESPENMVDLISYDAFGHGVSRRHAKIRRTETGYEVIDLESTNGTWINDQRLVPQKPYPIISGSLLRLGHMRMYVTFRATKK